MTISDFLELVGIDEDGWEFESDTVGGWTIEMLGRFPSPATGVEYQGVTVTVLAMDKQRVDRVLVKKARLPRKRSNGGASADIEKGKKPNNAARRRIAAPCVFFYASGGPNLARTSWK